MTAWFALAVWPFLTLLAFRRFGGLRGAFVCLFVGWAFLPVSPPLGEAASEMPGVALPSFSFVTKASVIGLSLFLAVAVFERARWHELRFRWLDGVLVGWCVLPLVSGLANGFPIGEVLGRTAYQTLAWGGPWLAGRLLLRSPADFRDWAKHLAILGVAYALLVLPEFFRGPFLYRWIYGPHTYAGVGLDRYVGYRPFGFLEDGNQLGMWMAAAALVATGWWRTAERRSRPAAWGPALVLALATLLYQSAGAILLLFAGEIALALLRSRRGRIVLLLLALAPGAWIALRASGVMDVRRLSETTWWGRMAKAKLKDIGRGSLGWRLKQEEIHLQTAWGRPVLGHGRTRWWRDDIPSRPWGLWLIVLGAFGVAGLLILLAILLGPVLGRLRAGPLEAASAAWLVFLLVTTADSLLNSTFLVPAVAIAGAFVAQNGVGAPRPGDHGA